MPTSFVSHVVRLNTLFDRRFQYSIPIYQRPFSWTVTEASILFDDLVEGMGDRDADGDFDISSFFLGALILTGNLEEAAKKPLAGRLVALFNAVVAGQQGLPPEVQGNFDVVDGKQRLITLKILICLLRDLSSNEDRDFFERVIGDGVGENLYRLHLCGGEREFLRDYVLTPGSTLLPIPPQDNISDSEKRLEDVRNYLRTSLDELSPENRSKLLDYIVNHCEVVIILSEQVDHAFKIFLSINDTGADLTDGDILKAELMSNLSHAEVENYKQIWDQWNDSLGEKRSSAKSKKKTFFNHFRYAVTANPASILKDIRAVVDKAGGAKPFINGILIPNAQAYEIINANAWPNPDHKVEIERYLGSLSWLPHDDWKAPAMQIITKYGREPEKALLLFQKLERVAYGLLILPGGYPERKKKYNPIKRSLRDDDTRDPFETIGFNEAEKRIIRSIIERGIHKSRPAAARLLLLRLDMEQSGQSPVHYNGLISQEQFSVEHLLPLSPEQGSMWVQNFADDKARGELTELLGNLFLVREKSENPQMKNFDYAQKHGILFANGADHPISLTNELRQQPEWVPASILQRHERLMAMVDQIWPQG